MVLNRVDARDSRKERKQQEETVKRSKIQGWDQEQTATQKYQSAQKYNNVFSIKISNVPILAFRTFFRKICMIKCVYICMNYRFVKYWVFKSFEEK